VFISLNVFKEFLVRSIPSNQLLTVSVTPFLYFPNIISELPGNWMVTYQFGIHFSVCCLGTIIGSNNTSEHQLLFACIDSTFLLDKLVDVVHHLVSFAAPHNYLQSSSATVEVHLASPFT